MYVTIWQMSIYIEHKPYYDRMQLKIEIFNECMVLLILYFLPMFSDWITEVEWQYTLGWIFVGMLGPIFFVNIGYVIVSAFRIVAMSPICRACCGKTRKSVHQSKIDDALKRLELMKMEFPDDVKDEYQKEVDEVREAKKKKKEEPKMIRLSHEQQEEKIKKLFWEGSPLKYYAAMRTEKRTSSKNSVGMASELHMLSTNNDLDT